MDGAGASGGGREGRIGGGRQSLSGGEGSARGSCGAWGLKRGRAPEAGSALGVRAVGPGWGTGSSVGSA